MLYEFIVEHRESLLERCRQYRTQRTQVASDNRTETAIALFLDQLTAALQVEAADGEQASQPIGGNAIGIPTHYEIGEGALAHGRAMQELGFSVEDVVHSYGDICRAIMQQALEQNMLLAVHEFRELNHCVDNAVASAVAEFSYQHDAGVTVAMEQDEQKRLAAISNELRNQLGTATLAVSALKSRDLTLGGATGTILERSLFSLGRLIDDMLRYAHDKASGQDLLNLISTQQLMQELAQCLEPVARQQERLLRFSPVDPRLAVHGSREVLQAAIAGLLQLAFQRSNPGDDILLHAYAAGKHVRIDIVCPLCSEAPPTDMAPLAVARQLLGQMQGKVRLLAGDGPFTVAVTLPRATLPT